MVIRRSEWFVIALIHGVISLGCILHSVSYLECVPEMANTKSFPLYYTLG